MTLTTLADVRVFVTQPLPKPYRDRPRWLVAARDLEAAVRRGDLAEIVMALRVALLIEGVACPGEVKRRGRRGMPLANPDSA
jgi:hypothetical protein